MKAFHDHLDTCPVCANQPFGLCPVGLKLLLAAALPTIEHVPKQTEQKEQPCKTQLT